MYGQAMGEMERSSYNELMEMSGAYDDEGDIEAKAESDEAYADFLASQGHRASDAHQLVGPLAVGRFLLAGNAVFTLRSRKTGARFTYKVSHKKGGDVSFVSLLTGSNNERDYSYMGLLPDDAPTALRGVGRGKSCASADAPSAKAFQFLLDSVGKGRIPDAREIWHEGRCGRCGRKLTVPESIETGLGPECADKV